MRVPLAIGCVVLLLSPCALSRADAPATRTATPPVAAARAWLASLDASQRGRATRDWRSPNRTHWGFRPFARQGLALREMSDAQRAAARSLWTACLSPAGVAMVDRVIARERLLWRQQGSRRRPGGFRDPGLYWLCVFGTPGADRRWGWRLGGHHLSLSLVLVGDRLVSATPWFVGGSPDHVRGTDGIGRSAWPAVSAAARRLVASLDAGQRRRIGATRLPADIAMQRGRAVLRPDGRGLSAAALRPDQRKHLRSLVDAFTQGVPMSPLPLDGIELSWRGSLEPGGAQDFRVVAPTFAMEHRGAGNHLHAVWRSARGDFGGSTTRSR